MDTLAQICQIKGPVFVLWMRYVLLVYMLRNPVIVILLVIFRLTISDFIRTTTLTWIVANKSLLIVSTYDMQLSNI